MAFYFLAVNYGAPIWMISALKSKKWTLFESSHYKVKQIALRNHTRSLPRTTINNECQHATPRQWSAYINASTEPIMLVERLNKTPFILIRENLISPKDCPTKFK